MTASASAGATPSLADRFAAQVAVTPDAVAVAYAGRRLTYRQLDAAAERLAGHLRALGVVPGGFIGILLDRSVDYVVAVLGILKAGCGYVPLPADHPRDRLAFMIDDARVAAVLTTRPLVDRLPAGSVRLVFMEEDEPWRRSDSPRIPGSPCGSAESPAYVMYTSGSTGRPKGVVVPQRAVIHLVCGQSYVPFGPALRTLLVAPVAFDASTFELWAPLLHGGTCVIHPAPLPELDGLGEVLRAEDVNCLFLTTALFNHVIDERPQILRPVRHLLTGGEIVSVPHVRRALAALPDTQLIHAYGPTETTTFACTHAVTGSETNASETIPIGRPIAHATCFIVDEQLRQVADGEAGELLIGGAGVALGYLGDPELTARRFIADPFGSIPATTLYRTGDRCRRRPDGSIEFLGREDGQVKIRGHRIELGEIEAALASHAAVRQAVVVVRTVGDERILRACVVPHAGREATSQTLRDHLAKSLPPPMIPAEWLPLQSLPLTANGKVDRAALAADHPRASSSDAEGLPLHGETERRLATIWADLLGRGHPERRSNFFDLGGHSLLAMRLACRLSREFGIRLPLRSIFEQPTLAGLAAAIDACGDRRTALQPVAAAPADPLSPATAAQRGMWLLRAMLPDPATYNQAFVLRPSGPIDVPRLQRSLRRLMERHPALRTALIMHDTQLMQQVVPAADIDPPCRELARSTAPEEERGLSLDDLLRAEARRPFDLSRPPLWRVLVADWQRDGRAVLFTFHHAILDDWSLRLFLRDLERCYQAAAGPVDESTPCGRDACPAAPPEEPTAAHEIFWREELDGSPAGLPWPTLPPRPRPFDRHPVVEAADGHGGWHAFTADTALVAQLRSLGQREGCTLFTTMLAAWHVWLHRFTAADDVVVGTPFACRWQPEAEDTVGCFLNTLPIRLRWDGPPGLDEACFAGVLRRIRDSFRAALDHAALPFERIVQLASRAGGDGRSPVCRVLFVLLEEELPAVQLGDAAAVPEVVHTRTSKYDLSLYVQCTAAGLRCGLEYDRGIFDAATIATVADQFVTLLRSIVADDTTPVSRLGLLSAAERRQVVSDFNATAMEFPDAGPVHEWVARQAGLTPAAVAVVGEVGRLTYGELDSRARRFAHTLRRHGVGPGSRVGLGCERSLEMVVGMLGILRAGAAYVPLDPASPPQRLAAMIADSGVRLVVTAPGASASWPAGLMPLAVGGDGDDGEADTDPAARVSADSPAYVMFTSGSTGAPKGVVIHHGALFGFLAAMQHRFPLTADDVVLQSTVTTFDISGYELFAPLTRGARLVLAPGGRVEPARLVECLATHGVTVAQVVPSLLDLLVDEPGFAACRALRQVLCGGEAMPRDLMRRFQARTAAALANIYGPTETTIWATAWECDPALDDRPPPIGSPLANTQAYVLDARLQPQPVGMAGELYLGGVQVALGYLDKPELTAERFVPDPFATRPGGRLYRTGDLCRWRGDGTLDFLGRIDDQVKIRGHRIELGEIETVLRRHPTVEQAVVLTRSAPRPGGGTDTVLRACIVPHPQATLDVSALRGWLADALPEPMLPAEWAVVDAIPLLASGKVDRRTLAAVPAVHGGRAAAGADAADGPRVDGRDAETAHSLLELEILRIWRRLFDRDDMRRDDDFFAIGGHSLLAARLVAELDRRFGTRIPIAAVFQAPTVASLARRIADQSWAPPWASLVPLQPRGSWPPLFCVHGWGGDVYGFVHLARQLAPEQPVYGLQAVGLDGVAARHGTVEEMAAHYVREIVSFRETGPYFVCGQSLGGWIAYEVARQLSADGRDAALLLFDTHPNHATVPLFWSARCIEAVYEAAKLPHAMAHKARTVAELAGTAWRQIRPRRPALAGSGTVEPRTAGPERAALVEKSRRREYFARAVDRYRPGACEWRVELFQSTDLTATLLPLFWHQVAGRHLTVHKAGCSHMEMLEASSAVRMAALVSHVLGRRG